MRHQMKKFNIGSSPSHRKSLVKNLIADLFTHGKIKTTHAKCKAIKPYAEKLITLAKEDTVANRRIAFRKLSNKATVNKLFTEIGPKFNERPGGYTRIVKMAEGRVGDNAKMSYIALVD